MNWGRLRHFPWLDTRARFVAGVPAAGALLDLGSSDGETLRHIAELRPDLRLFAVDQVGAPEACPRGCRFQRANLETDRLPWPDASMDAITCMQLVEHLQDLKLLLQETARLLKPGGRIFFETPHPKSVMLSSPRGAAAGTFTLNFYDDPTHIRPVAIGALAQQCRGAGLEPIASGISRNWLFVAAYPLLLFAGPSRKKFTAQVHWFGWSAYLVVRKSQQRAG
jgi:SAM-dependent methyltransferase